MKKVGIVLLNYKDYASKYLKICWSSILAQDYSGEIKTIIVDNASSHSSYEYIKTIAQGVEIVVNKNNDGFAKGNNDGMKKLIADNCDYILLLNMDAYLDKRAIFYLVKTLSDDDKIGAVQARLMLANDQERINSLGNITHFLGFGYCQNYQEKFKEKKEDTQDIAYPSGAAVMFKREVLNKVGLFDEKYFMYNEDQDLGWRIWLANYSCVVSYLAVAYHDYSFSRSIAKYYYMERNRIITSLKNYHLVSLIIFLPAFIVMELGLLLFSFKSGWCKEKLRAIVFFFHPKNISYIFKERKKIQRMRIRKEYEILKLFSGQISYQEIDNPVLKYIANPVLNLYFKISLIIIKVLKI